MYIGKRFRIWKKGPCDWRDIEALWDRWKQTMKPDDIPRAVIFFNDSDDLVGYLRFRFPIFLRELFTRHHGLNVELTPMPGFRCDMYYLRAFLKENSGKCEPMFLGYSEDRSREYWRDLMFCRHLRDHSYGGRQISSSASNSASLPSVSNDA